MNVRSRLARVTAVLAVVSLVALAPTPAHAEEYVTITGSGSTWSENALAQWRKNVASNYGMTINYSASGSSAGRSEFIKQTVDFAVSEIPFQTESTPDNPTPESGMPPYKYMPIVAGGTSLMYNLKIGGKRVTNLRLSGEVIAKIFSGQISKWNDAAIQADNPALAMPDRDITPVYRSDGSGTSAQFTLWMSKQFGSIWTQGMRSQFPQINASFKGQNTSLGVAGYVSQDYGEGAITYVEYSYAMKSGFPVAKVLNNAGYYVEPTFQSVAVALMSAGINADLTQNLDGVYNSGDPRSYPMSSYSYMIVPTAPNKTFTEKKGKTLGKFISYVLCEGQQQASALGYSPLPMNLVQAGSDVLASIPGQGGGVDFSACNNPTFKAGDSPSNNQLAATAPNPPDCDKRGPTQCVEGTGGAQEATAATGSGGVSGGASSADAGAGTTTTTDPAVAAGAQAAGSEPVYDANGNLVSGGGAVNAATSLPFTIAEGGWGPQAYVMLAAALLLVGAILVPPLVLRRRGSGARH